jgi:hypothetical protein
VYRFEKFKESGQHTKGCRAIERERECVLNKRVIGEIVGGVIN